MVRVQQYPIPVPDPVHEYLVRQQQLSDGQVRQRWHGDGCKPMHLCHSNGTELRRDLRRTCAGMAGSVLGRVAFGASATAKGDHSVQMGALTLAVVTRVLHSSQWSVTDATLTRHKRVTHLERTKVSVPKCLTKSDWSYRLPHT